MSRLVRGANVEANGIRQHYLRYGGRGHEIVLIPGITSPAITWGFVGERLGEHYDTYILDVRGRGLSQADAELDYGVNVCAEDVRSFIGALGLRRPSVIGHSMGARIATRACALGDLDLTSIVLVDPPVSGPQRRPYPSKLPWYVESIRLARRGTDADGMRVFCPTWTDEQLQLRAEWLHTCLEAAVVKAFRDFHEDDMHADLTSVHMPASLIVAGRGGVIEDVDALEIERIVPGLVVRRVPNAGHMIPWDDLDGFLGAVGAHFGSVFGKETGRA